MGGKKSRVPARGEDVIGMRLRLPRELAERADAELARRREETGVVRSRNDLIVAQLARWVSRSETRRGLR